MIDSWARGIVPQSSDVTVDDTNPQPLSDGSNGQDEVNPLVLNTHTPIHVSLFCTTNTES